MIYYGQTSLYIAYLSKKLSSYDAIRNQFYATPPKSRKHMNMPGSEIKANQNLSPLKVTRNITEKLKLRNCHICGISNKKAVRKPNNKE